MGKKTVTKSCLPFNPNPLKCDTDQILVDMLLFGLKIDYTVEPVFHLMGSEKAIKSVEWKPCKIDGHNVIVKALCFIME